MTNGTLTLSCAVFQLSYIYASVGYASTDYNSRQINCPDLHTELFLVHSPLLKESYLVSFPPLTYMLKFSGFPDLTSCLGRKDFARNLQWHEAKQRNNEVHVALNLFLAQHRTNKLNASAAAQERRANAQRRAAAEKLSTWK